MPTPEFKVKTVERKVVLEKEIPAEIKFFDLDDEETPEPKLRQNETPEIDLFSFEDEQYEAPESQSFKFEVEEKIEEKPIEHKTTFSEDKPLEFSFFVNEPIEEPTVETPQPKAEIKPEPVQIIEQKVENKPVETSAATEKIEVEDDFTFITKPTSNDKVIERRNKLKEFNSRYQTTDFESEFETVPAFRRKNINIEGSNASETTNSSFLVDQNGRMQVRENRFLNKDVD